MSEFPHWPHFRRKPAKCGDGSLYLEFDYRLRITVDESTMTWKMLIPPRGVFPDGEREIWDDSTWFSKEAELIDLKSYVN